MLARAHEPDEEVREAIDADPKLPAHIDEGLLGVRRELAPAVDRELVGLIAEIGKFLRLAGGGWSQDAREEFVKGAAEELISLPLALVLPAVQAARRRCRFASEFVPFVFEQIEPQIDKLRVEESLLAKLREIGRS